MNAGAYGGELKDVLKEVTVMTREGELLTIPVDKLEMGYRTSIIKTSGYLVLEAAISLKKGCLLYTSVLKAVRIQMGMNESEK